jgi:hypothetical protein
MQAEDPRNYLAMFDGEFGAERNISRYRGRDDGSHIFHNEEEYYEWWYMDAAFDNKYRYAMAFHYRNGFKKPVAPTMNFSIFKPDGGKIERYAEIDPAAASAHPDYCDVRMGESFMKDMGSHYDIFVKIGNSGARLKLTKSAVPWLPGNGLIYHEKETGNCEGWVVPVPTGNIEGQLYLEDETISVKGNGYHDHNWGNGAMRRVFDYWYWGRIHTGNFCVVYAKVVPVDKTMPEINPLLIVRGEEIVLATNKLKVELEDFRIEPEFNQRYAGRLLLSANAEGVTADIGIRTDRIVETRQLPKTAERNQNYYRFVGDFNMSVEVDGVKENAAGELLHEYIIL